MSNEETEPGGWEKEPVTGVTGTSKSDDFKIIKNAELPGRKPVSKYPFEKMTDVDDAFVVNTDSPQYTRSSIYSAQRRVAPDIKITIRTIEGGIHVQRTK